MRQQPVLSQTVRTALEAEFDRDLALLGKWLGRPLTCECFKPATAAEELNWVALHD